MSKYSTKLERLMKKKNFVPPKDIIADGQVHTFIDDGEVSLYVLDANKPVVGLFKVVGGSRCYKMKVASEGEENMYIEKLYAMKQQIAIAESSAKTDKNVISDIARTSDVAVVSEDDVAVARLAALTPLEFSRVAKEEAVELGVSVTDLKKAVRDARKRELTSLVLGPQLVTDIANIFHQKHVNRMRTAEVFQTLCKDNLNIWFKLWKEDSFSAIKMSAILSDYGVESIDKRIDGSKTLKVYEIQHIKDALQLIEAAPTYEEHNDPF